MEQNIKELPFLDIRTYIENNKIFTDIYYKTTDTHQFLTYNSCHPRHTKHSIPYGEARRLCTIIDDDKIRDERLMEMKKILLSKKLPSQTH